MGLRGEIYSTRVFVDEGRKTFFFNVKENRFGDLYLNLVESRRSGDRFKRSSVVVFEEDLDGFLEILDGALTRLESGGPGIDTNHEVGAGRRSYRFRFPPSGKPALEVSETRSDETGTRRESLRVGKYDAAMFREGLAKAVHRLKENEDLTILPDTKER
jgi:hypothetical protein